MFYPTISTIENIKNIKKKNLDIFIIKTNINNKKFFIKINK